MELTRVFDLLEYSKSKYNKNDVLAGKTNRKWITYSIDEYIEYANLISIGLMSLGLKKGDKVATITNNRPEWNFVDMALSQAGFIHVPVYPTINEDEFHFILEHSDASVVFYSDKALYQKLHPIFEKIPAIKHSFSFNEIEGVENWQNVVDMGKANYDKYFDELQNTKSTITPEETVTIIYTSGTTGTSKGVMLSHENLISNFISTSKLQPLDHTHKVLSFLPLSHVYERMMNYHFQFLGISIYYAESLATIVNNLKEIKADGFNSVPRLLEKVFDRIISKGKDLTGIKKWIFFWAVNIGLKFEFEKMDNWWYMFRLKIARKLVFSKWNEALGGNIKIIVSGGSALQPRLERIFWAAGMRIMEGYGLTETSPVIAVSHAQAPNVCFGTVGPILENVQVKIDDDGEILTKGPNLMKGYYKDPAYTKEVIDKDGWFHTGDIGVLVDDKFLKITDRKKEIFKLSSGKYVAPQLIENFFKESFLIEQCLVVGENEKFASALISPNFPYIHDWCSDKKIHFQDNKELINIPEVIALFQKEVNKVNKQLKPHEHVKRFRLVCEEWTPRSRELSPTLKLRRNFLYKKYQHILEEIYARNADDDYVDISLKKAKS